MSIIPGFDSPNDEYDASQKPISQKILAFEKEIRKLGRIQGLGEYLCMSPAAAKR
jgi:hypothetical protein